MVRRRGSARWSCIVGALLGATVAVAPAAPAAITARAMAASAAASPAAYEPVGPMRLADTRQPDCQCTLLPDGTVRVTVLDREGVPAGATSVVVTVSATAAPSGFVTVWPSGQVQPTTSVLNLSARGATSNSAVVPVGDGGAIDLRASAAVGLIVDLVGVFVPAASATAGRLAPLSPERLVDTRGGAPLPPGGSVTVALPDGVPPDATALAVNITSVGATAPGFLTAAAAGEPAPDTSFLNHDGSGAARAAAVVVPVSAGGFTLVASAGGHVLVDVTGWFTGPGAPEGTDGLFVAASPERLLDTRLGPPRLWPGGTREVSLPIAGAAALVTNVTAVAPDSFGYVTAYPAGEALPSTSTLNTAARGATTPNLAITPVTERGSAYYSRSGTELLVDLQGWFTGTPAAATEPVPPNTPPVPRVLLMGDSTLGGLEQLTRAQQQALLGFTYVLDAKPCRRLVRNSCTSAYTNVIPSTALVAINTTPGPFDIVVIKTGYNDVPTNFEQHVGMIVAAARAKGAKLVVWLTYSESPVPSRYDVQNGILRRLAGSAAYPDLVLADWRGYASRSSGWYSSDRMHLLGLGVWGTADYISRWVAYSSHLPCPRPWTVGGPIDTPCSHPDLVAYFTNTLPDLRGIYGI